MKISLKTESIEFQCEITFSHVYLSSGHLGNMHIIAIHISINLIIFISIRRIYPGTEGKCFVQSQENDKAPCQGVILGLLQPVAQVSPLTVGYFYSFC